MRAYDATSMSEFIPVAERERAVAAALKALRDGELVALPTDTVYAVVADAFSPLATQRLLGAKRRSRAIPLSVVIRSPRQVVGLVERVSEEAERLMAAYWPGPLTLVFAAADGLTWDLGETRGTVSLRMPADDLLMDLIADIGPLACSAANQAGQDRPVTVDEARGQLGEQVALYLDGGALARDVSTVVEVIGDVPRVLRAGAVSTEHVAAVAAGKTGWGQQAGDVPSDDGAADAEPDAEPDTDKE